MYICDAKLCNSLIVKPYNRSTDSVNITVISIKRFPSYETCNFFTLTDNKDYKFTENTKLSFKRFLKDEHLNLDDKRYLTIDRLKDQRFEGDHTNKNFDLFEKFVNNQWVVYIIPKDIKVMIEYKLVNQPLISNCLLVKNLLGNFDIENVIINSILELTRLDINKYILINVF